MGVLPRRRRAAPAGGADLLAADLAGLGTDVAGSQGRICVPLPSHRRPTNAERATAGLAHASWATADMAYRVQALTEVGGFDERFPRAFREDADLALRLLSSGWRLARGRRTVLHPVRPAPWWRSITAQAGNADDALMARLHGRDWHERARAPRGRRPAHVAITVAGTNALALRLAGRHVGVRRAAGAAALCWAAGTAWFAVERIAAGPRTAPEAAAMVATSVAIPPAATWRAGRGRWAARHAGPWRAPVPRAVLFDRDGTLVHDVPFNDDPCRVRPVAGARAALDRLRDRGVRIGVVSNQSGIARGLLRADDVARVHRRIESLLGPLDSWQVCPHGPADDCACRKPAPGLVLRACADLGVSPVDTVVIGDIAADVRAAQAAGARAVLVPTPATRPEEVAAAPVVAATLPAAVDLVLGGR